MIRDYGAHSRQTIRILLEHFGFDIDYMRTLDAETRITGVILAAKKIEEYMRNHHVKMRRLDLGLRVLSEIKSEVDGK